MHAIKLKFAVSTLLLGLSLSGQAAPVTLSGSDVSFTFDDSSLFGTGIVVGNSLFFQPTAFKAESLNGAGAVTASETLNITVAVTTAGYTLTDFAMVEQGDYVLNGTDAGVTASGRLGVTSKTTTCGFLACNDASIFNAGPFTDTGGATSPWSDGTSVALADTAGWGSDTTVSISFQNNLSATTLNTGEQATIQKKQGAIGLVVNPVPLPAAAWLFASGLLGLAGFYRRSRRR